MCQNREEKLRVFLANLERVLEQRRLCGELERKISTLEEKKGVDPKDADHHATLESLRREHDQALQRLHALKEEFDNGPKVKASSKTRK